MQVLPTSRFMYQISLSLDTYFIPVLLFLWFILIVILNILVFHFHPLPDLFVLRIKRRFLVLDILSSPPFAASGSLKFVIGEVEFTFYVDFGRTVRSHQPPTHFCNR